MIITSFSGMLPGSSGGIPPMILLYRDRAVLRFHDFQKVSPRNGGPKVFTPWHAEHFSLNIVSPCFAWACV